MANKTGNAEVQTSERKPRTTNPALTSIRCSVSNGSAERINNAEQQTKIDKGILVEMALLMLFESTEEQRSQLFEKVSNLRGKATFSMKF